MINTKSELTIFFQRSTVHGLSHASAADSRFAKYFWIVLLLGGTFGFLTSLVYIVTRYQSVPILTAYFSDYEDFVWPDITFCNNVPLRLNQQTYPEYNKLKKMSSSYTYNDAEFLKVFVEPAALVNSSKFCRDYNICNDTDEVIQFGIIMSSLNPAKFLYLNYSQFIVSTGISKERTLIEFAIETGGQGWEMMNNEADHFVPITHYNRYRSPCFTYKLARHTERDSSKMQQNTDALMFFLDTDFRSYMELNSGFLYGGAQVYVTQPGTLPQARGIGVLAGHNVEIRLKMQRTKYYKEKRDCRDETMLVDVYDSTMQNSLTYEASEADCKRILSQKLYYQACQCYLPFLPVPKISGHNPHLCFNVSLFTRKQISKNAACLSKVFLKYYTEKTFLPLSNGECGFLKKQKCNQLNYDVISDMQIMVEPWTEEINGNRMKFMHSLKSILQSDSNMNDTLKRIRRNIIMVVVKREKGRGDLVQEELEYPISQLVSDIGGLMGLWIGVSVVGLCESIELVLLLSRSLINKILLNRRSSQSANAERSTDSVEYKNGGLRVTQYRSVTPSDGTRV